MCYETWAIREPNHVSPRTTEIELAPSRSTSRQFIRSLDTPDPLRGALHSLDVSNRQLRYSHSEAGEILALLSLAASQLEEAVAQRSA